MLSELDLRAYAAEFVGSAMLLAGIVGSGIMAHRLCGGNVGLTLLVNSLATGGVLCAIVFAFGSTSGAHFNPVVSLSDAASGGMPWRNVPGYVIGQIAGAVVGTAFANAMFGLSPFAISHHARDGFPLLLGEFVATFGLLAVTWGCVRSRSNFVPLAVSAYIAGAYWFTSSTSFANPAVTIARSLTDTFAGIAPRDVLGFIVAQVAGAGAATALFAWLAPATRETTDDVMLVAHPAEQRS